MTRGHWSKLLIALLALPALLLPAASLGYILWRAGPVLDWAFVSSADEGMGFGVASGILPQLTGSLLLAFSACLLAAPVALGCALYYQLCAGTGRRGILLILLQMLQGIPPIVFGLAGLLIFVYLLDWGVSLASGAVVLAGVVLPLLTVNVIDALQRLPTHYSESARSLGLRDGELVMRVWLPMAWPGILTGLLLAMARALSETAPILFTATVFSGAGWPDSIFEPVTTLQTHVFYLAQEAADEQAVATAWGSAAVLVGVVLIFALLAQCLRRMSGSRSD